MDKLDKTMAWVESWTPYDAFVFNGPILAGLFLSICGLPFFKSLIGSFCVIWFLLLLFEAYVYVKNLKETD